MSTEILMPALSPTMTEGNLSKWLIKKGDTIKAGDLIAEIETDKATMEVEAVDEGVVLDLLFKEGEANIPVNKAIAIIGDPKEKVELKKQESFENVIEEKKIEKTTEIKVEIKKKNKIDKQSPKIEEDKNLSAEEITMRQALRDTMAEEMRKDKKVFLLGEEVAEYQGAYKVTQGLLEEFGKERVLDTPISEHGFTGLAVGAAFKGLRPILEFMTFNFSMQAIDQIINSAAKTLYMSGGQINCPIVFRGPNGAAAQVAAQHSQDFSSWYSQVPGLKVIAPSTPYNAKGLLRSAISDPNPVIFLENEILYGLKGPVNNDVNFSIPIGKANIEKEGKDLTIVTYSIMLQKSKEAALKLKDEYNLDVEIIDLQTLRPLDTEKVINSVKKTNRLITVEESWPFGSVGSEIANIVQRDAFDYLDSPIIKVNSADVPMPYSSSLEKLYLPQVDDIINAAKKVSYIN
jgi:pyruvate dehydrogenase E1 component beta subunit